MRMGGELVSLRILAVFGSRQDLNLLRQAAAAAALPVEVIEADSAIAARNAFAGDIDIAFLDAAVGGEERAAFIAAARSAASCARFWRQAASGSRSPKRREGSKPSCRSRAESSTWCFSTTTCQGSPGSRRWARSNANIR